jgi:hypothetical protein
MHHAVGFSCKSRGGEPDGLSLAPDGDSDECRER